MTLLLIVLLEEMRTYSVLQVSSPEAMAVDTLTIFGQNLLQTGN
ncbi:hypothetical protein SAMN02745220_04647 [Desulfopila aestuarii DSM 18488]|uniref:Uncharacterized protein n=1 Tax=Desulfopila aestuarii DSM 18488 TaxID=1121416 RepID=A0A1M7YJ03_9BACT|nr:hypothetical protein SAMN02745220_04647 [Desulfopila aestuarii DSM 18488]